MKRHVIIRADAGKHIGFGHFFRSLALAGYIRNDFHCDFASYNHDAENGLLSDYQLNEISKVCNPLHVTGSTIGKYNDHFLSELEKDDIVVLDNYYFTTDYQQKIKDKGCKLVCIDDVHDRHMLCDLLFTVCPLKKSDFDIEPYTKFYGGIEYAFLREPFFNACPIRNHKTDINRIVIGMGGADAFDLTNKMVETIHQVLPLASIDIIAGDTVNISDGNSKIATIHKRLSAENIAAIFDKADVGIFPASTICIEAFSRKLPVIAGYYVCNQVELYNYGVTHSLFSPLGCLLDDSVDISSRLKIIFETNRPHPVEINFKSQKKKIIELFKTL